MYIQDSDGGISHLFLNRVLFCIFIVKKLLYGVGQFEYALNLELSNLLCF